MFLVLHGLKVCIGKGPHKKGLHFSLSKSRSKISNAIFWQWTAFQSTKMSSSCKKKSSVWQLYFPIHLIAVSPPVSSIKRLDRIMTLRCQLSEDCPECVPTGQSIHSSVLITVPQRYTLTALHCLSVEPFSSDDNGKNCSSVQQTSSR